MFLKLDQTAGERFQFFTSSVNAVTGEITYDEPTDDGWVIIRPIQPFIEEQVLQRKRITEHIFNTKTRAMDRVSDFAELSPAEARREQDDTWDYAIIDFGNFKDLKTGDEIICNRENKLKLMKVPVFERFIVECLRLSSESTMIAKEEEPKNL